MSALKRIALAVADGAFSKINSEDIQLLMSTTATHEILPDPDIHRSTEAEDFRDFVPIDAQLSGNSVESVS